MTDIPRSITFTFEDSETHKEDRRVINFTLNVDATVNIELFPDTGREKITIVVEQDSKMAREMGAYQRAFYFG